MFTIFAVTRGLSVPAVTLRLGVYNFPAVTRGLDVPAVTRGLGVPAVTRGLGVPAVTQGLGVPAVTRGLGVYGFIQRTLCLVAMLDKQGVLREVLIHVTSVPTARAFYL